MDEFFDVFVLRVSVVGEFVKFPLICSLFTDEVTRYVCNPCATAGRDEFVRDMFDTCFALTGELRMLNETESPYIKIMKTGPLRYIAELVS